MASNIFQIPTPSHLVRVTAHCRHHGEYLALKDVTTGKVEGICPQCDDLIFEANVLADRVQHLYKIAGVPAIYSDKGLGDYETKNDSQSGALRQASSYAESYIAHPNRSLIVIGNPGTGKTHLSIGIIKKLIGMGLHCRYTTISDMFSDIKETYSSASLKTDGEVIKGFVEPAMLVIDEVGISTLSRAEEGLLYQVINGRYVDGRATIIVSNLGPKALLETLGDRLLDRLREGGGQLIDLQHGSYRR